MLTLYIGNVYTDIVGEIQPSEWKLLEKQLSFRPQGFQFSPMYRKWHYYNGQPVRRMWDGWKKQFWKGKKRTYFPTGLLTIVRDFLNTKKIPFTIVDYREKPIPNYDLQNSGSFTYYPYQEQIIHNACNISRGIIHAATGSGKTIIGAGIIAELNVSPFLFFVTSIDLLVQAKESLEYALKREGRRLEVGQIGGGIIDIKDINVCTIQTAVRTLGQKWDKSYKFDEEDSDDKTPIEEHREDILDLLHSAKGSICDECVSGDAIVITKYGPTKMKNLHTFIGHEILSFSGNSVVWKRITHFFPKGKKKTLKITLLNGDTITCTNDHPIMTNQGWKVAGNLHHKDMILCYANVDVERKYPLKDEVPVDAPNIYSDIKSKKEPCESACDTSYVGIKSIHTSAPSEVFDITVEDTHCFFANNMLVHNCQHWRADTCQLVMRELKSSYYRFALSATPFRDEGDDMLIQACFGRKIAEVTASQLIKQGFLVRPDIKMIHVRGKKSPYKQWQSIYKDQVVENDMYNSMIANIANAYTQENRLVLVLVRQINHGKILESMIPGSIFLSGNSPKKSREKGIKNLRNRYISCIISSTIFDEGIDVKPLDTVILAGQGRSKTRALQRIGRIIRKFEDENGNKKTKATAIDFCIHQKYLKDHAVEREKIYKTEPEFNVEDIDPTIIT